MTIKSVLGRLTNPLKSRKVRVAIATVIVAYLAEFGIEVSDAIVYTILGVGASVILGIAHEDNGAKSAAVPLTGLKTHLVRTGTDNGQRAGT